VAAEDKTRSSKPAASVHVQTPGDSDGRVLLA
jgi:hypothetical protein